MSKKAIACGLIVGLVVGGSLSIVQHDIVLGAAVGMSIALSIGLALSKYFESK